MAYLVVWLFGMVVLYAYAAAAATGLRQAAFFAGQACANADKRPAGLGLEMR
jgi:hypothetical protein